MSTLTIDQPRTNTNYITNDEEKLGYLNQQFSEYHFEERIAKLYQHFDDSEILVTSSFGIQSGFLLHYINKIRPSQQVHFIDTGYHFAETLEYKSSLSEHFGLHVTDIHPHEGQHKMTTEEKWWIDHPKMCCTINKIAPVDELLQGYKVWISGVMAFQTDYRKNLRVFERNGDIIKFHPLIDIDEGDFHYYKMINKVPDHALKSDGYGSVGCTHCTAKGEDRSGRWSGQQKTECGIHQNYFYKKEKPDYDI